MAHILHHSNHAGLDCDISGYRAHRGHFGFYGHCRHGGEHCESFVYHFSGLVSHFIDRRNDEHAMIRKIFMSGRFNKLRRRLPRRITAGIAAFLLAAICDQSLRGQTETNATNSAPSGIAKTWQSAREGSSNAWEKTKETSAQVWEKTKEGTSNTWSTVKEGTTQAWSTAKEKFQSTSAKTNYVYTEKDKFVAKAKIELDDLNRKVKLLSDKTAGATGSAKAEAQQKLDAIKSQRGDLEKKYDGAKNAAAADWDKAQAEFQKGYDDTKNSMKAMWDWLKSKTS